MASDPTMYVGATICSNSGVGTPKSQAQFKALIAPISNAAFGYKRNGFCMMAIGQSDARLDLNTRISRCNDVDAGR